MELTGTVDIVPDDDADKTPTVTCVSCGSSVDSKFCPECGEKQLDHHDFAVSHYLEESFEGLTHFDTKFFRTVKLLIAKPGMLSVYFSEGRRVNYVKPFQLFIICNVLFFLLAGHMNIFSQPLSSFYTYDPYVSLGAQRIIDHKAPTNQQMQVVASVFNEKMGADSKTYIVLFIPVFAAFFTLLFNRAGKYFSEHLVFATYFFALMLLFFTIYTLIAARSYYMITGNSHSGMFELVSSLSTLLVMIVYLSLAAKRFYKTTLAKAVAGALTMSLVFTVCLMGYRMLLFYKIIYSLH